MNNELQTALAEFVKRATDLLDAGTQQLPAVLNDVVAYRLFSAWFDVGIGVVLLAIAAICIISAAAVDDWSNDWNPLGYVFGGISALAGLLFTLGGVYYVYYVTHFPRLVILDYLKGLL